MEVGFRYGTKQIALEVPDTATVIQSHFPQPSSSPQDLILEALRNPTASPPLSEALKARRSGPIVVVVSDVTRPVPYTIILPVLLDEVARAGVRREEVLILIATGMHRPSTEAERQQMLGQAASECLVLDHRAESEPDLVELPGRSWAKATVRLNRHYVQAGFRLLTGLVEPHFMAGFSGGRKSVCPGLASLDTVQHFHGPAFMGDSRSRNANLADNPCHQEALSIARMAPPDFCLNVALNSDRQLVGAFAGDMEACHMEACRFVSACACPEVRQEADVVITSSGGYPLDATFYQCVKGFVSCLPAVRPGGQIVAFGSCSEGIGSDEYTSLMRRYSGRWQEFLRDVRQPGFFVKDQWQFQMHCRALKRVGQENLHFITDGLPGDELARLSVRPHAVALGAVQAAAQELVDRAARQGLKLALLPDGPYCAPVSGTLGKEEPA